MVCSLASQPARMRHCSSALALPCKEEREEDSEQRPGDGTKEGCNEGERNENKKRGLGKVVQ